MQPLLGPAEHGRNKVVIDRKPHAETSRGNASHGNPGSYRRTAAVAQIAERTAHPLEILVSAGQMRPDGTTGRERIGKTRPDGDRRPILQLVLRLRVDGQPHAADGEPPADPDVRRCEPSAADPDRRAACETDLPAGQDGITPQSGSSPGVQRKERRTPETVEIGERTDVGNPERDCRRQR